MWEYYFIQGQYLRPKWEKNTIWRIFEKVGVKRADGDLRMREVLRDGVFVSGSAKPGRTFPPFVVGLQFRPDFLKFRLCPLKAKRPPFAAVTSCIKWLCLVHPRNNLSRLKDGCVSTSS